MPHDPHAVPDILVVEDDPAELYLLRHGFATGPRPISLYSVPSVDPALAFLRRAAPYGHAPRPHLIVTSIKLPGKAGFDLLTEVKGDPALRAIPVIILSLYDEPVTIQQSYSLGANSYIVKPRSSRLFAGRSIRRWNIGSPSLPSVSRPRPRRSGRPSARYLIPTPPASVALIFASSKKGRLQPAKIKGSSGIPTASEWRRQKPSTSRGWTCYTSELSDITDNSEDTPSSTRQSERVFPAVCLCSLLSPSAIFRRAGVRRRLTLQGHLRSLPYLLR